MKNENKIIFIFTFFTVVLLVLISKKIIDIVLTTPEHTYIVENEYRDHLDLLVHTNSTVQSEKIEEQFDTDKPNLCPVNKEGITPPDSCEVPNTAVEQHITNSDTEYIQHTPISPAPKNHEEIQLVEEEDNDYDDSQLNKEDLVSFRKLMSTTPLKGSEIISKIRKQGTEVVQSIPTSYASSSSETTSHYQEKIATDTQASQIRSVPKRFTKKFRSLSTQPTSDDIDSVAVLGMLGLPLYGLRLNGQGDTGSGNTTGGGNGGSSGIGGNGSPSGHLSSGNGNDEENVEEEHGSAGGSPSGGGSLPPEFGTMALVSSTGLGHSPKPSVPQHSASAPASLSTHSHDTTNDEDTGNDNSEDGPKSLMNPDEPTTPEPGDDFEHIDSSDCSEKFVEFRAVVKGPSPSLQEPSSQTGHSDASFNSDDGSPKPLMDPSEFFQPMTEDPTGPSDDESVPQPLKDLYELGGSTGFGPGSSRSSSHGNMHLLPVPFPSSEDGYVSPRHQSVKKYMRLAWGCSGDEDGDEATEDVIIVTESGSPGPDSQTENLGEHRGQVQTSIESNGPEHPVEEPQPSTSGPSSTQLEEDEKGDTFEQRGRSGTLGSDYEVIPDSRKGSLASSVGGLGPFGSFLFVQPESDETSGGYEDIPSDKGSVQSLSSGSHDFEVLSKDSDENPRTHQSTSPLGDSPPPLQEQQQQDMENDVEPKPLGDGMSKSGFSNGKNTEEDFVIYEQDGDGKFTQQLFSLPPSDTPDGRGSPGSESFLELKSSGNPLGPDDTSIQAGMEENHYSGPERPVDSDIHWPPSSSSSSSSSGEESYEDALEQQPDSSGPEDNNNNNNNNNNETTSASSHESGNGQQHRGPMNRAAFVGLAVAPPPVSGSSSSTPSPALGNSSGRSSSGGAPSPATARTITKATPPQRVAPPPPPVKRSIPFDITSYRNSLQGLTQVLHAITQSSQQAMRSLSLAANTTYPDSSRFRIFGSASAKKPYPAKNQPYAMTVGAVMNPISSFVTGLAYSHTRHSTQPFSSYGKSETSKGSSKGKLNAHHMSALIAWNTAGEGITSFLEYAYGLGEAKINRTFFYKQDTVTNKGKTRTYTDGGTMRLGYRFAVTEHVSFTPYGELAAVRSQWKEYTEHTSTLPAIIHTTKEFTRERRLGIEGRWHVMPGIQFQAWGAVISSKKHNGHGIDASIRIPNQQQYSDEHIYRYTAHQKMGEFGAVFAIRATPNFGIRFNASIRTKAHAKTALDSQQVGTSMWYAF